MNSSLKSLKNWFGYTRRERRATFILLVIILIFTGARYIIPQQSIVTEEIPEVFNQTDIADPEMEIPRGTPQTDNQPVRVSRQPGKTIVDINECDSADLERLPGIGPVLSARIIKYRNLLGGFAVKEQLKEVYGLPEETFVLIAPMVSADSADVRRIIINKADFKELIRLPYLDRYEVNGILKYRELQGTVSNIKELVDNKIIPGDKAGKINFYFDFSK